jgi:hypothetical protein
MPPRRREEDPEFRRGGRAPLAGTMGEASSQGTRFRFCRTMFRLFRLSLLNPSCGGRSADLGEKREPRETRAAIVRKRRINGEGA